MSRLICILNNSYIWNLRFTVVVLVMVLFEGGCGHPQQAANRETLGTAGKAGTRVLLHHATGFSIEHLTGGTRIRVFNPWQGAEGITFSYLLVHDSANLSAQPGDMIIRVPVRRIICLSTTHIGFIGFLGEENSIVGVSGAGYVCNTKVRQALSEGRIKDVGYDMTLNYELIVGLHPDLVLAYGVNSEITGVYQKLKQLGIPTLFIGEYLEPSPLAKAEWVKLIACLYDREEYAQEKFSAIEQSYTDTRNKVTAEDTKPVLMTGLPWKESWNIPGGESFTARLIADAGGSYLWKKYKTRDNIPLNVEEAVSDARNADIWINAGVAISMHDILSTDERLADVRPFKLNQVYNNNAWLCPGGGNAFWESGVVSPDVILKELAAIIHPEIIHVDTFRYYRKLN